MTFIPATTGVINQRALPVTAAPNIKIYDGNTSAAAVPTVPPGALQGTDTANFIETYDNKIVGAGKALTPSGTVNDGNGGNNYAYNFNPATTGVINSKALTVTANNASKTYGQTVTFLGTEFTTSGLVGGDTVTKVTLNSTGSVAAATVTVVPYTIIASAPVVGTGLGNYSISYSNGLLTVTQASLTVTATNASRSFCAPNPTFGGILTGVQNGDNITASFGCLATNGSPVGMYDIVPSLSDPAGKLRNYSVTSVKGVLTIMPCGTPISLPVLVGSALLISVPTVSGAHYVLEYKYALSDPNWTASQTNLGNGGIITFTNQITSSRWAFSGSIFSKTRNQKI